MFIAELKTNVTMLYAFHWLDVTDLIRFRLFV